MEEAVLKVTAELLGETLTIDTSEAPPCKQMSPHSVLAETARLIGEESEAPPPTAEMSHENMDKMLRKAATCSVQDFMFVCHGHSVALKDILLLNHAIRLPVRLDWSNEHILVACSRALENNGYYINYCQDSEIRSSATRQTEIPEVVVPKVISSSYSKLQRFLSGSEKVTVDQDQINAQSQLFVHVLLGVDVHTKDRVLLFSGLGNNDSRDVLRDIISFDVSASLLSDQPLDRGYVEDLAAAFKAGAEGHLIKFVRPLEQMIRNKEFDTAQLYIVTKLHYKECGVVFPTMERPPSLQDVPIENEVDDIPIADFMAQGEIVLKEKLEELWLRHVDSRKQRKQKHSNRRLELCKQNREKVVLQLSTSEAARSAQCNVEFAVKMGLMSCIVLGATSAIYDRRPGKLYISFDHIMFYTNLLGFKTSVVVDFSAIFEFEKRKLTGPKAIIGDCVLAAKYRNDPNTAVEFIIPTMMECDKIYELIVEIETLRANRVENHDDSIVTVENVMKTSEDEAQRNMMASTILHDDEEEF